MLVSNYRIPATLPEARVMLTIPLDESSDARLLGCVWDKNRQTWWIPRDSVEATPYVHHWMAEKDPLRKATRRAYLNLERQNKRTLKFRDRCRKRSQSAARC